MQKLSKNRFMFKNLGDHVAYVKNKNEKASFKELENVEERSIVEEDIE